MAQLKNKKEEKKLAPITWGISAVRQWKDGGIQFALDLQIAPERTVTIYGCRIAAGKSGSNFISFPSRKGTDGKYYSHAYVRLTDAEQQEIMDAVVEELNNQ